MPRWTYAGRVPRSSDLPPDPRGSDGPRSYPSGPLPGRVALAGAAAGYLVLVVWQALTLPDRVPAHVGPGNEVTRWGTLVEHVTLASLTGAGIVVGTWALPALIGRLPRSLVNLPHGAYWLHPDRWPTARRMLADDLPRGGAATLAFLGFTFWTVGQIALGDPVPEPVFWIVFAAYMGGVLVWALTLQFGRRWRPPDGEHGRSR